MMIRLVFFLIGFGVGQFVEVNYGLGMLLVSMYVAGDLTVQLVWFVGHKIEKRAQQREAARSLPQEEPEVVLLRGNAAEALGGEESIPAHVVEQLFAKGVKVALGQYEISFPEAQDDDNWSTKRQPVIYNPKNDLLIVLPELPEGWRIEVRPDGVGIPHTENEIRLPGNPEYVRFILMNGTLEKANVRVSIELDGGR